jgi:hypothetical protein
MTAIDHDAIERQLDREFACSHRESEARLKKYRNTFRVLIVCTTCWTRLDALPLSAIGPADVHDIPLYDDCLPRLYREGRKARRRELVAEKRGGGRLVAALELIGSILVLAACVPPNDWLTRLRVFTLPEPPVRRS